MMSAAFVLPAAVPFGYLAAVSVPLAVTDARTGRLPNSLTVPGLVLTAWALLAAFLAGLHLDAAVDLLRLSPWRESCAAAVAADAPAGLGSAAVVVAVLGTGWVAGLVGMGDVKLGAWLGGMAGMLGMSSNPAALAQGAAAAAVVVTALLVAALIGGGLTAASRIPLGPPALAAFWAAAARLLLP